MLKTFLAAFAVLLAVGCAFDGPEAEDVGGATQAQTPTCFVAMHTLLVYANPFKPGTDVYEVKTMNLGAVSCPYKVQLERIVDGVGEGTPVEQRSSLGPYNFSTGTPSHMSSKVWSHIGDWRRCRFRVWYKFKEQYPNGSETWHVSQDRSC